MKKKIYSPRTRIHDLRTQVINQQWYTTLLSPAKMAWTQAWSAYRDPATRTRVITFEKTRTRKVYEPLLGQLVEMLKSNPAVA